MIPRCYYYNPWAFEAKESSCICPGGSGRGGFDLATKVSLLKGGTWRADTEAEIVSSRQLQTVATTVAAKESIIHCLRFPRQPYTHKKLRGLIQDSRPWLPREEVALLPATTSHKHFSHRYCVSLGSVREQEPAKDARYQGGLRFLMLASSFPGCPLHGRRLRKGEISCRTLRSKSPLCPKHRPTCALIFHLQALHRRAELRVHETGMSNPSVKGSSKWWQPMQSRLPILTLTSKKDVIHTLPLKLAIGCNRWRLHSEVGC